jgi:hypothetical protein
VKRASPAGPDPATPWGMRTALLPPLALLLLAACPPSRSSGVDDDDSGPDDDDAMDDDDTVDPGPCESGICDLELLAADATCNGPQPIPMPPDNMLLTSPGPGQIAATHFAWSDGCCPQIAVTGAAYVADERIEIQVDLFDDVCDCTCTLDVAYTFAGVPAGRWRVTVLPNGAEGEVEVQ